MRESAELLNLDMQGEKDNTNKHIKKSKYPKLNSNKNKLT
jgi:hypothetical protein